ncbi:MAG: response regulator [Planctomycetes bacterium]|nr:response regulator [Planctomycetota bacterium]
MTAVRHLLLIEDNPGDAHLLRQALEETFAFAQLHTVPTVNDALAFLGPEAKKPRPDLIILDLNLPAVCGAVGLSLIKATEDWRDIPVLVLTSSTRASEREECKRLGAVDYWVKPADWDTYLRFGEDLANLVPQWVAQSALTPNETARLTRQRPPASTETLPPIPRENRSQQSS